MSIKKLLREQLLNLPPHSDGVLNLPAKSDGTVSNIPTHKKAISRPTNPNSGGTDHSFPAEGLKYGTRNNSYVQDIQKYLLPQNLWTGNFLQHTKNAIATFIRDNNLKNYKYQDGSVITADLWKIIIYKLNGGDKTLNKSNQTLNATNPAPQNQNTAQNSTEDPNEQDPRKKGWFPAYLGYGSQPQDSKIYSQLISELQDVLNIHQSGQVDQATIDAVRNFVNTNKDKLKLHDDDLEILNNDSNPGITGTLWKAVTSYARAFNIAKTLKESLISISKKKP